MPPLQPLTTNDFAKLLAPVTTGASATNGLPDPITSGETGSSNTLRLVGYGMLAIGLIALTAYAISKNNETVKMLSRMSADINKIAEQTQLSPEYPPLLSTSNKTPNNTSKEQSAAMPESELTSSGEENSNMV